MLIDSHGRRLNYLRLSVTDRCNFRCYYCMPEEGMQFAPRRDLLSWEELQRLSQIFCGLGVAKIRITGGEPFVRAGLVPFMEELSSIKGLDEITLTTNGTLVEKHLDTLRRLGIRSINLSLDTLSRERFLRITRRDAFDEVYATVFRLLDAGFSLKLNCVVAAGKNVEDILPFVELTKTHPLSVRFLEEMPFNGGDHLYAATWNYNDILAHIRQRHPVLDKLESEATSTSVNYRVPRYAGSFGVIPAFSRTFCGTCNRLRLSATGEFRTCLYGAPAANLRDVLRSGADDVEIVSVITAAVRGRERDGFEAERAAAAVHQSMSVLGG